MICTARQIIGLSNQEECDGRGMKSVWGREEVHIGFWWGNLGERDHLKDPGIDGRIIIKWIFRKWDGGISWIDQGQNRGRWRALVNVVMNLRVP